MEKPQALNQLLEELRDEGVDDRAETSKTSHAKIYLTAGGDPITLNKEECELLLGSPETVNQLLEALGEPKDAAIELHLVAVDEEVQDALERGFAAVDEV